MICDDSHDGVERSNSQHFVSRNSEPLMRGCFGLKNEVAADLVNSL